MFKTKTVKVIIILFAIALFLELVVFNINSFRLAGGQYTEETLKLEDANLIGLRKIEEGYVIESNQAAIEWENLNKEIGTIKADVEISGYDRISFEARIAYTDETAKYYYDEEKLQTKEIVNGVDRTKYFTCHFAGNVGNLKIEILNAKNCTINIDNITINKQIPYNISICRLLIVFAIMLMIYMIFNADVFEKIYEKTNSTQACILQIMAIVFIFIIALYAINSRADLSFSKTVGDIYNERLVDSLIQGRVDLGIQPSEKLTNMENPYDYTARTKENVPYLYDYAYYDGNYYAYFSVLPALTLFVPFKMITGYYFPIALACIIYVAVGSIFTILFTKKVIKKFFPNVAFRWVFLGCLFMLFSSFLLFNAAMSRVYEMVCLMGYMLVMMGMYFAFIAWENERTNYKYLTLACIFLALAVWARPNLVIISLLLVPILLKKFIALCKQKEGKQLVRFILSVAIPYIIVAVCVMTYNYLRFDSVLEFGARYQLTSNDMGRLGYKLSTIPIGIWHYLFNPFQVTWDFPFIHSVDSTPLYIGFYGNGCKGIGIFSLNILMYALFLLPVFRKNIKQKNKALWATLLSLITVGLIMVIIITLMAASYGRYSLDFAWMFALATILTLLYIMEEVKSNEFARKLLTVITGTCITISIFANALESINSEKNLFKILNTGEYYKLQSTICFWE